SGASGPGLGAPRKPPDEDFSAGPVAPLLLDSTGGGDDEAPGGEADRLLEQLVAEAGNDDSLAAPGGGPADAGDGRGVHDERAAEEERSLQAGNLLEAGLRGAGTEGGGGHSARLQLFRQGLREGKDVRLRRVVARHVRARLEGGRRGDIDDPAPRARDHRGQ